MNLITANSISLKFGSQILLSNSFLNVLQGEKMALVGRNGCGKTSLLKILAGIMPPDLGQIEYGFNCKVSYFKQVVPMDIKGSAFEICAEGLGENGLLISKYKDLSAKLEVQEDKSLHDEFDNIVHKINELSLWNLEFEILDLLRNMDINPDDRIENMSAGLKRRTLLAKHIINSPDVLILDEPTNHLDIESILWLENFLKNYNKTLIFVSHDKKFLENVSTCVVELQRAVLTKFNCSYKEFLVRSENLALANEQNEALFDKKLAQEEQWIRKGIKARRTRNEGRVKALFKLREIRQARISRTGNVNLQINEASLSGQKVFKIENISKSFGDKKIFSDFSTTIYRGDKIAIIGKNGIGKTTLLNCLLEKENLSGGNIEFGTKVSVAYFNQLRTDLFDGQNHSSDKNKNKKVFEFISNGSDFVTIGERKINIITYLQKFLFTPEQIMGEIRILSGGEKNKLLLAKLFSTNANVLVLDEPTNDLDMQTIEILQDALIEFSGTVLIVSHDRSFLDNVTNAIFYIDEHDRKIAEIIGGYKELENHLEAREKKLNKNNAYGSLKEKVKTKVKVPYKKQKPEKFTNKQNEELLALPAKMQEITDKLNVLMDSLKEQSVFSSKQKINQVNEEISLLQAEEESLFERWAFLEEEKERLS